MVVSVIIIIGIGIIVVIIIGNQTNKQFLNNDIMLFSLYDS